jgi:hypothetical protein
MFQVAERVPIMSAVLGRRHAVPIYPGQSVEVDQRRWWALHEFIAIEIGEAGDRTQVGAPVTCW